MTEYFLPKDYQDNPSITFSENPVEYWTPARVKTSHFYQYYVYQKAAQIFRKKGFSTLLDIGAGPGTKIPEFFNLNEVELSLIDQPGMEELVQNTCPKASFYGTNLEDGSFQIEKRFDMIICADVIEHMEKPEGLLQIIRNHLSPNGLLVLSTPDRIICRGEDNRKSPNPVHVREWSMPELMKYVQSQGFEVVDSYLMPQKKVGVLKLIIAKLLQPWSKKASLHGCQTLILSVK